MARALTVTVMSTPREPASFPTICLACSIAGLGRQLLPNPRLRGRQTRVYGSMSAPASEAYGAEAGGSLSATSRGAAGSRLRTETMECTQALAEGPDLTVQHDRHCRQVRPSRTQLAHAAALCCSSSTKFEALSIRRSPTPIKLQRTNANTI